MNSVPKRSRNPCVLNRSGVPHPLGWERLRERFKWDWLIVNRSVHRERLVEGQPFPPLGNATPTPQAHP
jgi:hypothetical protein